MKRLIWFGIFVLVLTTACSAPPTIQPTPTVSPSPTIPPSPSPPPTPTRALNALNDVFRKFAEVKSFRAKISSIGGTSENPEMTFEVVTPDRYHLISKPIEAYVISSDSYVKMGDQWQKMQFPTNLDLRFADVTRLESELQLTTDTKLIGTEVVDGTPTKAYQYTAMVKNPTTSTTTSKLWVADTDGLPRKMESTTQAGVRWSIKYYDYNANIVIEPPIK